MKLTRPTLLLAITLMVTGCASLGNNRQNFLTMSEQEVYAYNLDQPLMKKVYCFQEIKTGSYIRSRKCMTVEDYVYRLEKSVLALDVLQPAAGLPTIRQRDF